MAQPESRLSRQIMAEIRKRGGFVFKIHGGPTMMNGLPDVCGSYRGVFIGLETKLGDNQASPVQRLRIRQIRASGGVAYVVRSVAQAMRVLDRIDASMDDSDG